MNRDQRLFFYGTNESTLWDTFRMSLLLGISPSARSRKKRYAQVKGLFRDALSDPDTVYVVNTKPTVPVRTKPLVSWLVLAVLVAGAAYEWKSFTVPSMTEWASTVLHRCGLK